MSRPLPTRQPTVGARHPLLTPEGIPLVLTVGTAGDRIAAFLLDMLLVIGGCAAIFLLALAASGGSSEGWFWAFALLALFGLFQFYFIWFEIRWQGRTPGKRFIGLRVIDAHGGALSSEAVFVRNLTREVEVFIPLAIALRPQLLGQSVPGWLGLLSVLWLFVLALLPLFNRDRLRIGDLVAGTLVVQAPRIALLEELGAPGGEDAADEPITFSRKQLDLYGVFELQVLEDLLRRGGDPAPLRVVASKIQRKIAWDRRRRDVPPREFLQAFYRAQRARLEGELLLGKAREKKRKGRLRRRR